MHLVRERAWYFPKTYGENFTIENSIMKQYFNDHYKKFKEKRAKKQFKFDEPLFDFVKSNKENFRRKWMDVEYVYFVVNVNENHWILCQMYLISWDVFAYDSNIACTTQ